MAEILGILESPGPPKLQEFELVQDFLSKSWNLECSNLGKLEDSNPKISGWSKIPLKMF